MYTIVYTSPFEKSFKKLDAAVRKRILQKVKWLAGHLELLNQPVQYLPADLAGLKKYRIGDWRLLFWVDHEKQTITLYLIEHRRSVYRQF